jgi:hypothetical protein
MTSSIHDRTQELINSIHRQFINRSQVEPKKNGVDYGIGFEMKVAADNNLWLKFSKKGEVHNVSVPLPFEHGGVQYIQQNEVLRATCPFWIEKDQRELDYLAVIYNIIFETPVGILPKKLLKSSCFLQQIVYGFLNGNVSIAAYRFQQAINEIVHKMPLHETVMNSFVMNHRLMIVDPDFDELRSPEDRLAYQKGKAQKYFPRGWTAIGLSDGTLADKNYLLKADLRRISPFGVRFHNPQRNLYSTLGMKGDELPNIRSRSMQTLMDQGITRTGWNLFTAFVDIPDVFEDQIMVDSSLVEKFVTAQRRYQIYGTLMVKEGQKIKSGAKLGVCPDGNVKIFDVDCKSAVVSRVVEATSNVGGTEEVVYNVVVEYIRHFKDGFKITNMHGNKGIVRIANLGYAIDPRTGEQRKLEVIVGAKTVGKRKNYGQILEALFNNVLEADGCTDPAVIPDDWYQPNDVIVEGLTRRGFRADGTWDCDTYAGKVKAVCGNVFWGVIKTPEDQLWKGDATLRRNGKEVRTAGLKFSHVEFRALATRFGENNAILDEVMSYAQGSENLHELFKMMRAMKGEIPSDVPVVAWNKLTPLDQTNGTIVDRTSVASTIVDEDLYPAGFVMHLPLPFQTILDEKYEVEHEGYMMDIAALPPEVKARYAHCYVTQMLYVPSGVLRRCWRHDTGKLGLGEVGVLFNNVLIMSYRLAANPEEPVNHRLYYSAVGSLFHRLARMAGTKRGEIANYAMSVRYPFSAKAVAALSTTLPKNTIEIHRSMAQHLHVHNGDVVLTERFPCLGFMSVRPQKVRVTDDPMAKYVIRVSGNSLVSQNLDFDGDVLYIASMHTPEAKLCLMREFANPNRTCYDEIKKLNKRKGAPHTQEYTLDDMAVTPFADMTNEEHADIVEKNTGVKAQTGPVIALTYNLMRIVENSDLAKDHKMRVAVEMFLEKAAQSVFEQKHGGRSLYEIVIEGVCTADVEMLVKVGFKRSTTTLICELIRKHAAAMNIHDLRKYHERMKELGAGNIISRIVRVNNRIYFASRATLHCIHLLDVIEDNAVDVPSKMFKWVMAGKADAIRTALDSLFEEKSLDDLKDDDLRDVARVICAAIEEVCTKKQGDLESNMAALRDLRGKINNQRRTSNAFTYRGRRQSVSCRRPTSVNSSIRRHSDVQPRNGSDDSVYPDIKVGRNTDWSSLRRRVVGLARSGRTRTSWVRAVGSPKYDAKVLYRNAQRLCSRRRVLSSEKESQGNEVAATQQG